MLLVGIATGLVAVVIDFMVDRISTAKYSLIANSKWLSELGRNVLLIYIWTKIYYLFSLKRNKWMYNNTMFMAFAAAVDKH